MTTRLTAKGQRWLTRWRKAKHLAGWTFILLACLAFLALVGLTVNAAMAPHFAKF